MIVGRHELTLQQMCDIADRIRQGYELRAEGDDSDNDGSVSGGGDQANGGDQGSGQGGDDGSDTSGSLLDLATGKRGDGDAGGDGDGGSGDDGSGDGGDGGEGSTGQVGLVLKERPGYLPEQFHDAETGAVDLEALSQSWKDGQDMAKGRFGQMNNDQLADLGLMKIPEGVVTEGADYTMAIPEGKQAAYDRVMVPMEETNNEDPIVHRFRGVAAKHGLTQTAFNDIIGMYVDATAELLPPPINQKTEMAKLGDNAQQLIDATAAFGDSLEKQGVLNADQMKEFRLCCKSAAGVGMIEKIRQWYGEDPVPVQIQEGVAKTTDAAEISRRQKEIFQQLDEGKITEDEANRKYDALMKESEEKVWGSDPAGSSVVSR